MERSLVAAGRSRGPVTLGPWLSEIGFELLYWIPFTRALLRRHRIDPDQVTVISRGGVAGWYRDFASRYVDVHDVVELEPFKAMQHERIAAAGDQKQLQVTAADHRLWQAAGEGARVHPLVMYSRLRYYWAGQAGTAELDRRCDYRRFAAPAAPELPLPDRYVAAKPYFSDCFPDTPENRRLVKTLLIALADEVDVVLLSPGVRLDDHAEIEALDHPRVHGLGELRPRDNLAVQTQVVSGAAALLGTYGGPAYLAPFLGVTSVSFLSEEDHNPRHLEAFRHATRRLGCPAGAVHRVRAQTIDHDVRRIRDEVLRAATVAPVPEAP